MRGSGSPARKPGANEGPASKAASEDVDEAWDFTAERWDVEQADSLLDKFEEKFRLLARFPETGRRREELAPGLRSVATSGFVIL